MRIESVEFFYAAMPEVTLEADGSQDALLVRVSADGIDGWGECEASPLVSVAAFVTLLTNDPDKDEATLKEIAKKQGLKNVPLTVFDGVAGPEGYKIAEKANLTVTMWVDGDVKASRAFAKGEYKTASAKAIIEDTKKILN